VSLNAENHVAQRVHRFADTHGAAEFCT